MQHGGVENGKLPVRFDDFEAYGISEKSVAPAIREVEALGFVRVTVRGRASKSDFGRNPNKFELTYIRGAAPHFSEPTDDWKQHRTIKEAQKVAEEARAAKNETAVAKSKARAARKSFARGEKIRATGVENHPKGAGVSGVENHPTALGIKNHPTFYISDKGGAA